MKRHNHAKDGTTRYCYVCDGDAGQKVYVCHACCMLYDGTTGPHYRSVYANEALPLRRSPHEPIAPHVQARINDLIAGNLRAIVRKIRREHELANAKETV